LFQIGHCLLQKAHAHQQQGQTNHKIAYPPYLVTFHEHENQRYCTQQHRQAEGAVALAQTEQGDNPCRDGSAYVGTHNHGHGSAKRKQSGVDKRHHHDGGGRRRLDDRGHCGTRQDTPQRTAGHLAHHGAHLVAGKLLQPLAHQLHAEEEHGQSSGKINNYYQNIGKTHLYVVFISTYIILNIRTMIHIIPKSITLQKYILPETLLLRFG